MQKPYLLRTSPRIRKDMRLVPARIRPQVNDTIDDLAHDPYPPNAEELRDHYQRVWKIKVDGWRIFYTVNEADRIVKIISVQRRTPNTYIRLYR